MTQPTILFAGGDVGGCRALLPLIRLFSGMDEYCVRVLANGFLSASLPEYAISAQSAGEGIAEGLVDVLVFSTSTYDELPLRLAIQCRKHGIPSICILDSWMNYTARLRLCGGDGTMFLPDCYIVMDEIARARVIREGFPEERIAVTGQPALAGILDSPLLSARPAGNIFKVKRVTFVAEPPERLRTQNSRTVPCGYDTENVFPIVCREMQKYAEYFFLEIAPHPSDGSDFLQHLWKTHRGRLRGAVLAPGTGRIAALSSDGVVGMASILLYECLLAGIPSLSLQPGLANDDLSFFVEKEGMLGISVRNRTMIRNLIHRWVQDISSPETHRIHKDAFFHEGAAERCAEIIRGEIRKRET